MPHWLLRNLDISLYAVMVYAALASHSDATGSCFPSQTTLAEEARCSERKVREALIELRDRKIVTWISRNNRSGRQNNVYQIAIYDLMSPPAPDDQQQSPPAPDDKPTGTSRPYPPAPGAGEVEPVNKNQREEDKNTLELDVPELHISVKDLFEKAWSHWPKRTERKRAFDKFRLAARLRAPDILTADIIRFGDAYLATTDTQFVPALGVWLNGERWDDALPTGRTQPSPAPVGPRVISYEEFMIREAKIMADQEAKYGGK
jgi:hypothetical protein